MKKILFAFIFIISFSIMGYNFFMNESGIPFVTSDEKYRESYNSEVNMTIARKIALNSNAEKVAVIGNNKVVLVGIFLRNSTTGRNEIKKLAEQEVKAQYKDAEIEVEIESNKAEKIFELTQIAENGASDKMLGLKIKELKNE